MLGWLGLDKCSGCLDTYPYKRVDFRLLHLTRGGAVW